MLFASRDLSRIAYRSSNDRRSNSLHKALFQKISVPTPKCRTTEDETPSWLRSRALKRAIALLLWQEDGASALGPAHYQVPTWSWLPQESFYKGIAACKSSLHSHIDWPLKRERERDSRCGEGICEYTLTWWGGGGSSHLSLSSLRMYICLFLDLIFLLLYISRYILALVCFRAGLFFESLDRFYGLTISMQLPALWQRAEIPATRLSRLCRCSDISMRPSTDILQISAKMLKPPPVFVYGQSKAKLSCLHNTPGSLTVHPISRKIGGQSGGEHM